MRSLDMAGHKPGGKFARPLHNITPETTMDDYFDIPAGYRDADLEMAALTARANRSAALRKRGICDHGWIQGLGADGQWHGEGPSPERGYALCLHCHEFVPDLDAL